MMFHMMVNFILHHRCGLRRKRKDDADKSVQQRMSVTSLLSAVPTARKRHSAPELVFEQPPTPVKLTFVMVEVKKIRLDEPASTATATIQTPLMQE